MDNAKIHRAKILRKIFISINIVYNAIHSRFGVYKMNKLFDIYIVYNAPHSPMLNPTEFVFGVYKMNKLFDIYKKKSKNLVFLNKKYECENIINQN